MVSWGTTGVLSGVTGFFFLHPEDAIPIMKKRIHTQTICFLIGGLNPVASAHEVGIEAENHAMSSVIEYNDLESFWNVLEKRGHE